MKRRLLLAVAAAAVVAVAGGAYAWATSAGGGAIAACAQKVNGQLRLDNGAGCRPSEDAVALAAAGAGQAPMYAYIANGAVGASRSSGVLGLSTAPMMLTPIQAGVAYCFDLASTPVNAVVSSALVPNGPNTGIGFGASGATVAGTPAMANLPCPAGTDAAAVVTGPSTTGTFFISFQ